MIRVVISFEMALPDSAVDLSNTSPFRRNFGALYVVYLCDFKV
jgi:hypothetical protein